LATSIIFPAALFGLLTLEYIETVPKCFAFHYGDQKRSSVSSKTYVRLLLEFNSVIWSPHHKSDMFIVEQVQRRLTKRLYGLRELPYDEHLSTLNLHYLELRKLQFDLVWCYKILFGLVHINS